MIPVSVEIRAFMVRVGRSGRDAGVYKDWARAVEKAKSVGVSAYVHTCHLQLQDEEYVWAPALNAEFFPQKLGKWRKAVGLD